MRYVILLAVAVAVSGCSTICPLFDGSTAGMFCPVEPEEVE